MKLGKSLQELAVEIERQASVRKDFLAPSTAITMYEDHGTAKLEIPKAGSFGINGYAHAQIATKAGIPKQYYDKMLASKPALIASHVNHWFQQDQTRNMVRTLDGTARALLSDRYRPLDNYELMTAILPYIVERKAELQVVSSDVTDRKFYLKLAVPAMKAVVKVGDEVMAGVTIQNSEVGDGSLEAAAFVTRLACLNGMKVDRYSKRRNHVGRALSNGDDAEEFYRDDTREADDRAFFLKIRDTVSGILEPAGFEKIVNELRESTERKIEGKPEDAVEVLGNRYQLNEGQKAGVLRQLIDGGLGLSQYSLIQAVTRIAEDQEDYNESSRLENIGGDVLTLSPADWKVISQAEMVPVRRRKATATAN